MTPYEVLRIAKEASPDEIRVAFRRAASAAHIGTTRAETARAWRWRPTRKTLTRPVWRPMFSTFVAGGTWG